MGNQRLPGRAAGQRAAECCAQSDLTMQKGEDTVNLNAPKQITWLIALALVVIGVIVELVIVPVFGFWIVVVAAVLLLVASYLPNL